MQTTSSSLAANFTAVIDVRVLKLIYKYVLVYINQPFIYIGHMNFRITGTKKQHRIFLLFGRKNLAYIRVKRWKNYATQTSYVKCFSQDYVHKFIAFKISITFILAILELFLRTGKFQLWITIWTCGYLISILKPTSLETFDKTSLRVGKGRCSSASSFSQVIRCAFTSSFSQVTCFAFVVKSDEDRSTDLLEWICSS